MTALKIPSLERRLLRAVGEEVAAEPVPEWPERSLQLGRDLLRKLRANAANLREALEQVLAEGVEARSFVRDYSPFLPDAEDYVAHVRNLVERVSSVGGAAGESLLAELRPLEEEYRSYRDLLAEALARASEPPRSVDWERIRAAEEACARGQTKPFSRR
jgi:hypothetical protein